MKLLTIFASLLVVAASYPTVKTWTLNELSEVIEKSEGDPDMRKYYIDALNTIMYALFTGKNEASIHANILSPSGHKKWTLSELKEALDDPNLHQALRPYYQRSYHYLLNDKQEGAEDEVEVVIPALDISTWSVSDLKKAMNDPVTNKHLRPYLEKAMKEIKEDNMEKVTMVTPVGLVPKKSASESGPKLVARLFEYSNSLPLLQVPSLEDE